MALKLTITNATPLLPSSIVPSMVLYVKLGGLNFNAFTNAASLPLTYRYFDQDTGGPIGDWLSLPLPQSAPIILPRFLMMSKDRSPFEISYEEAAKYLKGICGDNATIEDVL